MASESPKLPTSLPDRINNSNRKIQIALDENPVQIVVTEPSKRVKDVLLDSMEQWNLGLGKILSVNINNGGNDSPTSVDSGFNTSSPASNRGDSTKDPSNAPVTPESPSTQGTEPPMDNEEEEQEDSLYDDNDTATLVAEESPIVVELSNAFAELAPPTLKTSSLKKNVEANVVANHLAETIDRVAHDLSIRDTDITYEFEDSVYEEYRESCKGNNSQLPRTIEKVASDSSTNSVQMEKEDKRDDIPILPTPEPTTTPGNPVTTGIFKEPASRAKKKSEIPRVGKKAEKTSELLRIIKHYEAEVSCLVRKQEDDKLMKILERREKAINRIRKPKKSLLSGKPPTLPSCHFTPYRIIYLLLKYYYPLEMIDDIITERWNARVAYLKKKFTFNGPSNPRSKEWPPAYTTSRAERDAKDREENKKKLQAAMASNKEQSSAVTTDSQEPPKVVAPTEVAMPADEDTAHQERIQKLDAGIEELVGNVRFEANPTSQLSKPKTPKKKETRGRKKKVSVSISEEKSSSEAEQDNGSDEDFDIRKAVKEMPPVYRKGRPKKKSKAARTVFITEDTNQPGPSEQPVLRPPKRASLPPEDEIPKQRRSTRLKDNPICFKDVSDAEFLQMLKIARETEGKADEEATPDAEAQPEEEAKLETETKPEEVPTPDTKTTPEKETFEPAKSSPVEEMVETVEEMKTLEIVETKGEAVAPCPVAVVRGGRGRPRKVVAAEPNAPVMIGRVMFDEAPNPLANMKKRNVEVPIVPRNAGGFNNFQTEYSRRVSDQTMDALLAQVWTPTESKRIDIKGHFTSPHIRRAFFNTSCYCYAIATLQMLLRAPQVYSIIASHLHKEVKAAEGEEAPKNCLTCSLAATISVRPDMDCPDFEALFSKVWPDAVAFEMQCVMEAMQKFFLRLDTEYMRDHPDYYKMRPEKFSPFRTFFEIEYIIHYKCTECHHTETLRDRSIYLTVNAEKRNSGTMQDLISKMTVPEHMNGLFCSGCRQPNVKVHYTFTKLPEVLLYFIPRIKDGKILETFVPAQKHLTMKARTKPPQTYTLSSFIVHIGESSNAGHYVLYEVNKAEDGYNKFDDEKVTINARLGCSYRMVIAMYRRNEDIAKDVPVDMIFDGRGNIMYADEKHCGPRRL